MFKRLLPLAFLCVFLGGCGEKGPPPGPPVGVPSPVKGRVLLGSAPLNGGVVQFFPVETEVGGKLRFQGGALPNAKGEFVAGFNGDGKGLVPGDYLVTVTPREVGEVPGSNSKLIPSAYRIPKETPLKVTINTGDNDILLTIK